MKNLKSNKKIDKASILRVLDKIEYDLNFIRSELSASWHYLGETNKSVTFMLSSISYSGSRPKQKFFAKDLCDIIIGAGVSCTKETLYINGMYDAESLKIEGENQVIKIKEIHSLICEYINSERHNFLRNNPDKKKLIIC